MSTSSQSWGLLHCFASLGGRKQRASSRVVLLACFRLGTSIRRSRGQTHPFAYCYPSPANQRGKEMWHLWSQNLQAGHFKRASLKGLWPAAVFPLLKHLFKSQFLPAEQKVPTSTIDQQEAPDHGSRWGPSCKQSGRWEISRAMTFHMNVLSPFRVDPNNLDIPRLPWGQGKKFRESKGSRPVQVQGGGTPQLTEGAVEIEANLSGKCLKEDAKQMCFEHGWCLVPELIGEWGKSGLCSGFPPEIWQTKTSHRHEDVLMKCVAWTNCCMWTNITSANTGSTCTQEIRGMEMSEDLALF